MTKQSEKEIYEFMGATKTAIEGIHESIDSIKNNHLKHIDAKMNGLLFTVLASVIIAVIVGACKILMN